ncbi:MAG TPA: transporter [Bryobacteraceae bacterium]|nr:transporter [Bryobacteraceae bacterium]
MIVTRNRIRRGCRPYQLLMSLAILCAAAAAQDAGSQPAIQDNSFLVEEAYNQERGVVQHINTFSRLWNSKDWVYTFTQEWPMPWEARHQLSYTLIAAHAGAFSGSGAGLGDLILNYRYQLVGNGEARTAFSPRLSVLIPTGDEAHGRGFGAKGMQANLPLSVVLNSRLVSHWNAGATFVAQAHNAMHQRADSLGYNLGQSLIWLAHPRFNVLLETVYASAQSVVAPDQTEWTRSLYLSPGIRWAYNFKNGLQIVPGIGVPIGAGPSAGERGVFLYLSFEHPFGERAK